MTTEKTPLPPVTEFGRPYCFGLIMVKPNALDQVLEPVITATFDGDVQAVFEQDGCDFVDNLANVDLCGRYYRDLSAVSYGKDMIDLFYSDKRDRRYYPMIQRYYLGKTAFLLLGFSGDQENFDEFLVGVKGEAATYDEFGKAATTARGIRGALTVPYRYYPREASQYLSDEDYEEAFAPVVQNFIHVCDTPTEVATAITHLLDNHDIRSLKQSGYPIDSFVRSYVPNYP